MGRRLFRATTCLLVTPVIVALPAVPRCSWGGERPSRDAYVKFTRPDQRPAGAGPATHRLCRLRSTLWSASARWRGTGRNRALPLGERGGLASENAFYSSGRRRVDRRPELGEFQAKARERNRFKRVAIGQARPLVGCVPYLDPPLIGMDQPANVGTSRSI